MVPFPAPPPSLATNTMTAAVAESPAIERLPVAERVAALQRVRVVRLRDEPAPLAAVEAAAATLLRSAEVTSLREAGKPLADLEAQQTALDAQQIESRAEQAMAKLPVLAAQADALKAQHPTLRGAARLSTLHALDAAKARAAADVMTAVRLLAEPVARYVALGQLRDEWVGTAQFDPLGLWSTVGAVLAPNREDLPKGRYTAPDIFGRDCAWSVSSPAHIDAVRRAKHAIRAEVESALCGARWPF